MAAISEIFHSYSTILDVLPENIRLIAALVILVVLAIIFLRFVQKSVAWLVLFILLLPAALPALREIGVAIWEKIIVPFLS